MKTHQDIVDAHDAIGAEASQARHKIDEATRLKYLELQAVCGEVGHVFGKSMFPSLGCNRQCLFCYAEEPQKA